MNKNLSFTPIDLINKKFPSFSFLSENLIGKWHMVCFLPKGSREQVSLSHLKDAYEWLNKQNIIIICVSSSPQDEVTALRLKYDLPFPVLCDYGGERSQIFTGESVGLYDTIFLIDEQGIIRKIINKCSSTNIADALTFFMKKQQTCNAQTEQTRWISPIPSSTYDLAGKEAPQFQLPDEQGKLHTLADYRGKWCILFFLPDSSQYYEVSRCFDGAYAWLRNKNIELIGIAPDSVEKIAQNKRYFNTQHPLLSDKLSKVAQEYFIKHDDWAVVIIDGKGIIQRVMKKSWAEEYLVELLLFFIKKDTSVTKTALLPKSQVKAHYNGYGDSYSNFDLPDEQKIWHRLSNCSGKWCILFFPIDNSEECIDHICSISEVYNWLHNHGVEVVCISTLEPEALARIKKRLDLKFITLSDFHGDVGSAYGAFHWCGDTRMTLILNENGKDIVIEEGGSPTRHVMSILLFFMNKFV
jgi:peroxiredoxin